MAPSYFLHIFSSTWWNPIEFGIHGKLFQGESNHSHITAWRLVSMEDIGNYWNCTTWINLSILVCSKSSLLPLCVPFPRVCSPSVLSHWEWDLGHFEVEIWVWLVEFWGFGIFYYWNGLVGLSFICKWLLNVESLEFVDCDGWFFLYTMYCHVCTLVNYSPPFLAQQPSCV